MSTPEIKKEIEDIEYDEIKTELSSGMNEDIPPEVEEDEENDKKELDLDSIDMMQIPIQLDDGIDILDDVKYVFYFSGLRNTAILTFNCNIVSDARMKALYRYQTKN